MKVFSMNIKCIKMNISPSELFNRVSSFLTMHSSRVNPHAFHTPRPAIKQPTFDETNQAYLDAELDKYMKDIHSCTSCKKCWPSHKKIACKLLKLHPSIQMADTFDDTFVSTPTVLHNN
jgi:hypothetical protein